MVTVGDSRTSGVLKAYVRAANIFCKDDSGPRTSIAVNFTSDHIVSILPRDFVARKPKARRSMMIQGGAPKIAKLVYNSNNYGFCW